MIHSGPKVGVIDEICVDNNVLSCKLQVYNVQEGGFLLLITPVCYSYIYTVL